MDLRTQKHPHRQAIHGVHSLDRFVLTVPDLAEAQRFYDAFGLKLKSVDGRVDLYTHGHPHRWASLYQGGDRKKLQYLRFACFPEDLAPIRKNLKAAGFAECEPHPLGDNEGFWVQHPDGFPVQIVVGAKSSPDSKTEARAAEAVPTGKGAAPSRSRVTKVLPRRLAHALFFTPDVERAIRFYEALGMRVSDRSADVVAFLHGVHGSDHHLVALAKSHGAGLHHSSWDVSSFDEVGLGMEQMYKAGYLKGWGVGRHVLGSNYFYYSRDPWGSHAEYSFDIDYVPGDFDWQSATHPPEDSFYVWGPQVPPDFVTNFEVDAPAQAPA